MGRADLLADLVRKDVAGDLVGRLNPAMVPEGRTVATYFSNRVRSTLVRTVPRTAPFFGLKSLFPFSPFQPIKTLPGDPLRERAIGLARGDHAPDVRHDPGPVFLVPHAPELDGAPAGVGINHSHAGQAILWPCLLQEGSFLALQHARRSTSGRATRPPESRSQRRDTVARCIAIIRQ
jgi:hypothetical protein